MVEPHQRPCVESLRAKPRQDEGGGEDSWCVETESRAAARATLTEKERSMITHENSSMTTKRNLQ